MNETKRKRSSIPWGLIFNVFIICLTIGLVVFFIFSKDGFIDLLNSGLKINMLWLILALFMHLLNIAIDATVIYLFVRRSTPTFKVREAIVVSMVGQFYCAVTPGASGGQPMQVLTMTRMGVKASNATAALIQKFLVWQFTLTGYSIAAMALRFSMFVQSLDFAMWILTIIGFIGQVLTIVVLLLASFNQKVTTKVIGGIYKLLAKIHLMKNVDEKIRKLEESLTNFHNCNKDLNKDKKLVVEVYVLTFVQLTVLFLIPYCIAKSFGNEGVQMFDMICAQSFVSMVSGLVPMPGGSGAAEYCFSAFFGTVFNEQMIKSAILIWRTITYYLTIIISLPFAGIRKKKALEAIEPETETAGTAAP
ncbi:MAG: lysylphosphatidylglycerol synthase transmembrane domain-containing protein [Acutalibacteraceae bacterium]|nr:flippase-like domain-containing protein [Clostridia bacterium]MEE3402966.1 lysylphosphatidylglycerol synthase transmembrane domain-containing protein [Acutalibacteraceae bacterium]